MCQKNAPTKGLVIGKFMPPHLGHQYLIDFAKSYVDELYVLVCSLKSEPIPGSLRYKWMSKLFPHIKIIHVIDENPQSPDQHPNFWNIWKDTIERKISKKIDFVFASEDYGWKLAEILEAEYIPVDHSRQILPISGTSIRKNPIKNWDFICGVVRPYFLKRVCILGPESTGKTTLTRNLAKYFNTIHVEEYARGFLDLKDGKCNYSDIEWIAKGQKASEEAASIQANRVLFVDTNLMITTIWSDILFKKCPNWIKKEAKKRVYDLYLLTDTDVPWVNDPQRYQPKIEERQNFFKRCERELKQQGKKYVVISGTWEERLNKSIETVKKFLN